MSSVDFGTARAVHNLGVKVNFLIFCVYFPCLLCVLNEICCKRLACSADSACESVKIDTGKAVLYVWV